VKDAQALLSRTLLAFVATCVVAVMGVPQEQPKWRPEGLLAPLSSAGEANHQREERSEAEAKASLDPSQALWKAKLRDDILFLVSLNSRDLDLEERWSIANAIVDNALETKLDPYLVLALIRVESGLRTGAVGPKGARGLMQVQPHVAREVATRLGLRYTRGDLFEPAFNIRIGTTILAELRERYGDLNEALGAYNLGPAGLKRILRSHPRAPSELAYARRVRRSWKDLQTMSPLLSPPTALAMAK